MKRLILWNTLHCSLILGCQSIAIMFLSKLKLLLSSSSTPTLRDEASEPLPRPRRGSLGSDTTLTIDPKDPSRRGIRRAVSAPSIPNMGFMEEYRDG